MPDPLILMHPLDDVAITRQQLIGGTVWSQVTTKGLIPVGHKMALRTVASGQPVRRYNQVIGFALRDIAAGEHVHTHNLGIESFERDYAIGADAKPAAPCQNAEFMGLVRASGAVGTRNYIGILSSVNCSATVAKAVADHFSHSSPANPLSVYPNVDGVVALTHGAGCGMDDSGEGMRLLRRTLMGYAGHANFAAILIIGLGCEANQITALLQSTQAQPSTVLQTFNIQDAGGTRNAVAKGIALVESFLPAANSVQRQPCSAEHLVIGLQCGGSDGFSGVSANPALGNAMDRLVAHGGTAILSETPEIYGAEHLLTRRAVSREVAKKLIQRIHWWEAHVKANGGEMNNNPSPGNKAGGLTTILEKSLGAVSKGGTTNLCDVVEYAEKVTTAGLVYMDTPGYDPVSATGQVAGGANLLCFTTGRGSAYGCAPSPSLKLATNTALWERQRDDMDINCGDIVDGSCSIEEKGAQIFERMLAIASGEKTRSELHGYGQNEFVPWQLGATM